MLFKKHNFLQTEELSLLNQAPRKVNINIYCIQIFLSFILFYTQTHTEK